MVAKNNTSNMAKTVPLEEQAQNPPHGLSDSEGDTVGTPRPARAKPRKTKMAAAEGKPKTRTKQAEQTLPVNVTTDNPSVGNLSEIKRMYAEMIEMRDQAQSLRDEAEEARATARFPTQAEFDPVSNCAGMSHEYEGSQPTWEQFDESDGQELNQYWEEDEEEDDSSLGSYNAQEQLIQLRLGIAAEKSERLTTEVTEGGKPQAEATQKQPFSAFRAPPKPKPQPAAAAGTPTTTAKAVETNATPKPRRVFKLATGLQEGKLLTELQEVYKKVKKPVAPRVVISESMAGVITHYYAGVKHLKTIRDISREYTGLADVTAAKVQPLNEEIRFAESRKDGESSLLTATKGVVGALTAIAPVLDIILQRGNADPELNEHGIHMLNAIRMLVSTHSQMRFDRIASVKKVVYTPLGKELIKNKRDVYGDLPELTEHLLGENLGDKNKVLMKSLRASDNCMQTSLAYRGKRRQQQDSFRQNTPYSRPRGGGRFRQNRGARGGSTWGMRTLPTEKRFGRTNEDYAQYGNPPPTFRGGRGRGGPSRGFQK